MPKRANTKTRERAPDQRRRSTAATKAAEPLPRQLDELRRRLALEIEKLTAAGKAKPSDRAGG